MILKSIFKYTHQPYIWKNNLICVCSDGTKPIFKRGLFNREKIEGSTLNWKLIIASLDMRTYSISNEKLIQVSSQHNFWAICSPVVFEENQSTFLSFVGGQKKDFGIIYNLYVGKLDTNDAQVDNIKLIKESVFTGCENPKYTLIAARKNLRNQSQAICLNKRSSETHSLNFSLKKLYRVVFLENDYYTLLVTGVGDNGEERSLVYTLAPDMSSVELKGELKVNNQPVYKSIFREGLCIYAVKNQGFEERQLYISSEFSIN